MSDAVQERSRIVYQDAAGAVWGFVPVTDSRPVLLAGRYRLSEERLGRGGMGEVLAGRDEKLNRRVAVKLMLRDWKEDDLARFAREARVLAALQHPNIVAILDAHAPKAQDQAPFIVMEMLTGRSLAEELDAVERIEPERLLRIGVQVASALNAAHEAGIVHRDLKPSNVMLIAPGTIDEVAKVIDFGVARDLDAAALTATGSIIGTPAYMSPEQALGRKVGPLSDIYSFGALLYHAFVGEPPFKGEGFGAVAVQVAGPREATMSPDVLSGELGGLATLILECLAKDPARRPASAAIVGERLRSLHPLAGARRPPHATVGALAPRAWPPAVVNAGKPTSLWWVVLAVVVVAIGATVGIRVMEQSTARPDVTVRWTPPPTPSLSRRSGSTQVAAMYRDAGLTCARMDSGELYCWPDQDRNAVPSRSPMDDVAAVAFPWDGVLVETSTGRIGWWAPFAYLPTFGFWPQRGRLGGCTNFACYMTGEDGVGYELRAGSSTDQLKPPSACDWSKSPCELSGGWTKISSPANGGVTHLVVLVGLGALGLIEGSLYLSSDEDRRGWIAVPGVGSLESMDPFSNTTARVLAGVAIKRKASPTRELLELDTRATDPRLSPLPRSDTCDVRSGALWCGGKEEKVVPMKRSGETIVYGKHGRDHYSVDPRRGYVGYDLCVELLDASRGQIRFACGASDSTVTF